MAGPGLLTDRGELESLFDELGVELRRLGARAEVVMVGGSWMLWHSQRAATRDVDSARRFDTDISAAIDRVGARHGLREDWLNDAAAPYWPADASFDECATVFEQDSLVVRTPSPAVVFVMKLYRAQPQDREDMVYLWPLCNFRTAEDAVRAYRAGYPQAPDDDYLGDYIDEISRDAADR